MIVNKALLLSVYYSRLLRDSHLDLKIETLKENSHLILDLDSQIFSENSSFSFSTLKIFLILILTSQL